MIETHMKENKTSFRMVVNIALINTGSLKLR